MSMLKRAWLYCSRQKLKSLILFCVLTVLAAFVLTGMATNDAIGEASLNIRSSVSGIIHLEIDSDGNMDSNTNQFGTVHTYYGDYITDDIIDAISKVDGVVDYASDNPSGFWGAGVDIDFLPAMYNLSYTDYGACSSFTAALSSQRCSSFTSGQYKLVDGRHITPKDKHVVMISKELADYNDLSVGDTITLYCLDSDAKVTLEVVGIFSGTEGTGNNALSISDLPANQGFVDYTTMFENFGRVIDGYTQVDIFVEDPDGIQNVYNNIKNLTELKDKTLTLSINTEDYDVISNPLENMQSMVNTLILVISLVSVVILTLLMTIWIRGRKHEIGIMISVGKNKTSVIGQFLLESISVSIFAFALAVPFSHLLAKGASDYLMAKAAGTVDSISVVICANDLLPTYGIGFAIIAVSVLLASWTVIRLRPKNILSKMS